MKGDAEEGGARTDWCLLTLASKSRSPGEACCVCFEAFDLREWVQRAPSCGHPMHTACSAAWSHQLIAQNKDMCNHDRMQSRCPMCRSAIPVFRFEVGDPEGDPNLSRAAADRLVDVAGGPPAVWKAGNLYANRALSRLRPPPVHVYYYMLPVRSSTADATKYVAVTAELVDAARCALFVLGCCGSSRMPRDRQRHRAFRVSSMLSRVAPLRTGSAFLWVTWRNDYPGSKK